MEAEPPKAEPPKRKRRWFQFSLRTWFILVAIAVVQSAVCLPMLREWQQRRQEEAEFDELVKLIKSTIAPSTGSLTDNEANRDEPKAQIIPENPVAPCLAAGDRDVFESVRSAPRPPRIPCPRCPRRRIMRRWSETDARTGPHSSIESVLKRSFAFKDGGIASACMAFERCSW